MAYLATKVPEEMMDTSEQEDSWAFEEMWDSPAKLVNLETLVKSEMLVSRNII